METIKFTIPLAPRTKKNHQQIIFVKGRMVIIQNKAYLQYERDCSWYIPKNIKSINTPINLKCTYYMQTKRKVDLNNLLEATTDILTKYNILVDDNRDVVAGHDGSRVLYDKTNPRVEIEITRMEKYEQWKTEVNK